MGEMHMRKTTKNTVLWYGVSGQLAQKIDEYIAISKEPAVIIEKDATVEKYKGQLLFDKYEVVSLDKALKYFPNSEIWVTYRKANKTAELLLKKIDPSKIHFFEADLEYRLGCEFLGHFISYRMTNFTPCCIEKYCPVEMTSGTVERRFAHWHEYVSDLIDKIRNGEPNPCAQCPRLKYGFWHKTVDLKSISFATNQPGDVCNFDCVYCFAKPNLNKPKDITEGFTTYEIIKQLALMPEYANKEMFISLANGEFSANKNCDEIFNILMKTKWKVTCLTNGSIYRESFAKFLKTGQVLRVQTSLDAGTPETFKKVKGLDAFDKVVNNLKRYELSDVNFILKYIFLEGMNDNEADVDGFIEVAKEVGCKRITISSDLFKPFTPHIREMAERMILKAKENDIEVMRNTSYLARQDAEYILRLAGKD